MTVMPIVNIQRRMAEQGRIRLGEKKTSSNGKTYPSKLSTFRFTSPSQRLIEDVAKQYGGTAQAWDNAGKAEFEVITDARAIPVIVVKGGFSQWHELWSKAGCLHRCDGEKDPAGNYCDPDDLQHQEAIQKPTTRLSVMLAEIETLGVWRMESKGWNAAAELPSMAELAMYVGDLVPATLSLAERSSIIETEKGPQTSRFVVPVLDLHVSKRRLIELVGGAGHSALGQGPSAPALGASSAPALEAPRPDYAAQADTAASVDEVRAIWKRAQDAGHLDDELKQTFLARVETLKPPEPHMVEGTVEPDAQAPATDLDEDALWLAVVSAAGALNWSTERMEQAYSEWTQGELLDDANPGRLAEFRQYLQQRRIAEHTAVL